MDISELIEESRSAVALIAGYQLRMTEQEKIHIILLKGSDQKGLKYIYDKYHDRVYQYIFRLIPVTSVVEELVSDVFLRVWLKRRSIDQNIPIGGLLQKISRDYAVTELRRISRNHHARREYKEQYCQQHEASFEEMLQLEEFKNLVETAITFLPPKCQEIFKLSYHDCLNSSEISRKLGVSDSTVRVHKRDARIFMRQFFEKYLILVFCLFFDIYIFYLLR